MSARARDWAWQQIAEQGKKLPGAARMVLLYLAERANDDGYCWAKVDTIGECCGGLIRRRVFRQTDTLCEAGLIAREHRYRDDGSQASNGYQLLIPAGWTRGDIADTPPVSLVSPPRGPNVTPPVAPVSPPRVALVSPQEPSVKNRHVEPSPSGPPGADGQDPAQPDLFGAVPAPAVETVGQKANRLTTVYTDRVPLSRFPAIAGIVRKALQAGKTEAEITDALARLGKEGRPVTVDTLRIEIDGFSPRGGAHRQGEGRHDEARSTIEESLR